MALAFVTLDDGCWQVSELFDLLQPLAFERGRRDNQDAANVVKLFEKRASGDRLDRLSQPHLVGEQSPAVAGQMQHTLLLIGVEWTLGELQGSPAALQIAFQLIAQRQAA